MLKHGRGKQTFDVDGKKHLPKSYIVQNDLFLAFMLLPRSYVTHVNTVKSEEQISHLWNLSVHHVPCVLCVLLVCTQVFGFSWFLVLVAGL